MQNGLGLLRNTASNSATQVSVFSPPDSSEMLQASLPGGRATISMPHSSTSSASSRMMSASPPPNSRRNSSWKWPRTVSSVVKKQLPAVDVDPLDDPLQRRFRLDQVAVLAGELLEAGFELFQFIERLEIDRADVVDLIAQLGDFPLHGFAIDGAEQRAGSREDFLPITPCSTLPALLRAPGPALAAASSRSMP